MSLFTEFAAFIKEYKILGLATAFVIGTASTAVIKSLVDNIVMPLFAPLLPGADWQTWILKIGPISLGIGAFISALINFIIIAFAVFAIAKYVFREEIVAKK